MAVLGIALCMSGACRAQIKATTSDGRKVILSLDGTWKYDLEEIEKDSTLLKNITLAYDTASIKNEPLTKTMPVVADSAVSVPVVVPPPPPVVKRPPPNLDCSALIAVQRSIDKEKFVGVLRKLVVSEDSKTGFVISFYKTKHGPIIWTTNLMGYPGACIDEDTKMNVILKDGTTFKFTNEGGKNCEGNFKLYFGGNSGKEYAFELIQSMDIRAIRVWNSRISEDEFFAEDHAAIFKAAMHCILNIE